MSITQFICSAVGVVLAVTGTVAHELGEKAARWELHQLPGGTLVIQYPAAAIAAGMLIFTLGHLYGADHESQR